MVSAKEHYDRHLAPLYSWMSGGGAPARERFREWLRSLDLHAPGPDRTALDLGAGSGFQSIPLAEAGYDVTAVDTSETLLAELLRDAGERKIRTIAGDLRDLRRHCPRPAPTVIVCMGDTLAHLSSAAEAAQVLHDAAAALASGGYLLLSFRDYTVARTGADRFISVRADADRIFTCFLEYEAAHLAVHDIVHTRAGDGWNTAVSAYRKIRLAPDWVRAQLVAAGLVIVRNTVQNGLVTLAAQRPVHA
ncbi:MAG TPA: class I SAM-dependent methyltransferase [Opitutaceae bacterium]|nr:class I SAM-dependent methyltransferase [Opitutaceae bacterium]